MPRQPKPSLLAVIAVTTGKHADPVPGPSLEGVETPHWAWHLEAGPHASLYLQCGSTHSSTSSDTSRWTSGSGPLKRVTCPP